MGLGLDSAKGRLYLAKGLDIRVVGRESCTRFHLQTDQREAVERRNDAYKVVRRRLCGLLVLAVAFWHAGSFVIRVRPLSSLSSCILVDRPFVLCANEVSDHHSASWLSIPNNFLNHQLAYLSSPVKTIVV